MATGDVTISLAVAGGVTKSASFDSATRVKAKLFDTNVARSSDIDLSADADWQVYAINKVASMLVDKANRQLESEAAWTAKSYTAAT